MQVTQTLEFNDGHRIFHIIIRGAGPGSNTKEISDKLGDLRKELEDLEDIEKRLDEQRLWIQQSLKNISEDPENGSHAYVTHEDICKCFHGETLLAVQAPSGTHLEVPVPENVSMLGNVANSLFLHFI